MSRGFWWRDLVQRGLDGRLHPGLDIADREGGIEVPKWRPSRFEYELRDRRHVRIETRGHRGESACAASPVRSCRYGVGLQRCAFEAGSGSQGVVGSRCEGSIDGVDQAKKGARTLRAVGGLWPAARSVTRQEQGPPQRAWGLSRHKRVAATPAPGMWVAYGDELIGCVGRTTAVRVFPCCWSARARMAGAHPDLDADGLQGSAWSGEMESAA